MIALRNAIDRASERRWVGLLVLLLLATLLVLVGLHSLEHAAEAGNVLLCVAIASVLIVALRRDATADILLPARPGRSPPRRAAGLAGPSNLTAHSPPLRL